MLALPHVDAVLLVSLIARRNATLGRVVSETETAFVQSVVRHPGCTEWVVRELLEVSGYNPRVASYATRAGWLYPRVHHQLQPVRRGVDTLCQVKTIACAAFAPHTLTSKTPPNVTHPLHDPALLVAGLLRSTGFRTLTAQ